MKVLFVTPYLYNQSLKKFQKNKTGFGILLNQMAEYISNYCQLLIFTNVITPELKLYGATIVKHTWWDIFKSTSFKDITEGIREAFKDKRNIREKLLCIYYKINCAVLRRVINEQKPDLIHCHGVGKRLNWYYETCINTGIPVLMTLHGLIATINVAETDKNAEINFLKHAEASGYPVTVISTGIKRRLSREPYNLTNTNNISVIPNGTVIIPREINMDIRRKYSILENEKILITLGTVCYRKNQIQIIKALSLLHKKVLDMVRLIIIGYVSEDYPIEVEIRKHGLEGKVIITGFVPHEELQNYYSAADLNILASIDEGFGLSMIEGFVYGVPCVTFSDLDAVHDIYDERAMLLCGNRSDDALAKSLEIALNKSWDKEWIKKYSKNFSLEKMTERYIDIYKKIVYGSK